MGTAAGGRMLRQSAGGGRRFNRHDGCEGSDELRQRYMPLGRPGLVPKLAATGRIWTVSALLAAGAVATYGAALGTDVDAKTATGHALVLALVVGSAAALTLVRRQPRPRAMFNVAQ